MLKIRSIVIILLIFLIFGCTSLSTGVVSTTATIVTESTTWTTTEAHSVSTTLTEPTSVSTVQTTTVFSSPTSSVTTTSTPPISTTIPSTTLPSTTLPTTTIPTTLPLTTLPDGTTGGGDSTHSSTMVTTVETDISPMLLQPPGDMSVEDGILHWSMVDQAIGYLVLVDDQEFLVDQSPLDLDDLSSGVHQIRIKALGDSTASQDSEFSTSFTYEIEAPEPLLLDSPTNIVVTGSVLSWDAVTGAVQYAVQINDDPEKLVLANSYDLGTLVPGTYQIKIIALGDQETTLNSPASTIEHIIDAIQLPSVQSVNIIDGVLLWDEIENAFSYMIDIQGEIVSSETTSLELNLSAPGEYWISIKAVGDSLFYLDSGWSEAIRYEIIETSPFITVEGDQLYLQGELFRFVSFNVPNLHILEDPYWHRVDPWEQEDAIQSVKMMGGRVIRTYTLSVTGGVRPAESGNQLAHILGKGVYSEELFVDLDKAIQLAGEHGVYLIIPLIDEWSWFGGITEFSALYGKTKSQFFTNTEVKQGFKDLISYVLNRTNTFTGVKYKDDPAILAWELGNELRSATDSWIAEMATYVKSIDTNHLLMSGRDKITTADLNNPNIDIVSSHYYTNNGTGSFADRAKADRTLSAGKKPFIIGEYGLVDVQQIENMIVESVNNGSSGSLIWSLRFRNVNGGFYYHNDTPSRSYHFPGYSLNDDYFETRIINFIIEHAHLVTGGAPYAPTVPDQPLLFDIDNAELTWRGATGSAAFSIERKEVGDDHWTELANAVSDAYVSGPFYVDQTVEAGKTYEYRIRAINLAGYSEYSNIVTYFQPN